MLEKEEQDPRRPTPKIDLKKVRAGQQIKNRVLDSLILASTLQDENSLNNSILLKNHTITKRRKEKK